MSRNYKFHNPEGLYFISFATVFWVDVFVRRIYFDCIVENLNYCIEKKGIEIYAWCIMPSHVHLFPVLADSLAEDPAQAEKPISEKLF